MQKKTMRRVLTASKRLSYFL